MFTDTLRTEGNTIVLSSVNLIGYEISHYSIQSHGAGKVRLKFTSAEITKGGKTTQAASAPNLSFPLPSRAQHIRLIYLVRSSRTDHNMAIAASKDLNQLNAFTIRVKGNPAACKSEGPIFCTWVPEGVAVRPE